MDISDLTTLSRLLDEALDRVPEERASWLESLGPEYEAVKPRLRRLLTELPALDTGSFLDTLPKLDVPPERDDEQSHETEPREGVTIGPYRLVRELAEGGMGSVWLAERTDGILNRPVALKLPHGSWRRAELVERVAREREILATLNHPNIARLYDAGVTADGQPYLALEHVEGRQIDEYCREAELDVRARVRLLLQVTRAVAHAHAKLVIHRDLKPSNILVTHDGQISLLDFGIAKLLDEGHAKESTLTRLAGRRLTPEYASPEQIAGAPLGVASDVYSLGVVLYEILAGTRPYRLRRESRVALEEAILEADVRRPSEVGATPATCKALAGDLDTIVLKALKKHPSERYGTADALGDDLERYLEGRPVIARPDSRWYRMQKFIGRNRLAVVVSAAMLLAILSGAGIALWQMLEANRQRDAARQQQLRAEAFSQFMSVLLQDAGADDRPLRATELLDRGTELLDRQQGMEESVAAYMRYEISRNYLLFNQTERELALLEQSAEGARRLGDANLLAAAECSAAWSLTVRDRDAADVKLAIGERALAEASNAASITRADCLRARSRLLQSRGDIPGAIAAVEEALGLLDERSVQAWSRRDLLLTQLADFYRATDRFKEALALSEQSLQNVRNSGRTGSLLEFSALSNRAGNLYRLGEVAQAAEIQRQLLSWLDRADLAKLQPIGVRGNYGVTLMRFGQAAQALELAEAERALAERVGNVSFQGLCQLLASRALWALGRSSEAWERLRIAEALWQSDPKMYARMLRESAVYRAEFFLSQNNFDDARRVLEATLNEIGYPARHEAPGLDRALRLTAALSLRVNDASSAERFASDALEYARKIARDEKQSADVGEAALLRARARADQGKSLQAAEDATLAVEALGHGFGSEHPLTIAAVKLLTELRLAANAR